MAASFNIHSSPTSLAFGRGLFRGLTMTPETDKKISTLRSIEEIEGWRWGVSVTRDYEDGEVAALVIREKQIREGRA